MDLHNLDFRPVQHNTAEYNQTVILRDELLRKPLGFKFSDNELQKEDDSYHLTCWSEDILVACLVLKPISKDTLKLRQFAVSKAFQAQGIGKRITYFAETFALEKGYKEITMHARESAVGFYKKLGYHIEGNVFIEVTIPHYFMRKEL